MKKSISVINFNPSQPRDSKGRFGSGGGTGGSSVKVPNDKERSLLMTIRVVRDLQVREISERYPESKPSRWVNAEHLRSAFKITMPQLEKLRKKGFIDIQPSGGFGPEVRLAEDR